jgi:tetratricopeptide (TPR) repeat protein
MADVVFPAPGAAYRADTRGRAEPFGPSDDVWLAAATELHLAATIPPAPRPQQQDHLYSAIGVAIDLLGDERVEAFAAREWPGERLYVDPIVVLADTIYYGGARNLAALMLDDIRRTAPDLTPLQLGRLLFRRARIAWSLGASDEAAERYEWIATLGTTSGDFEIKALAELGLATLAQFRGDFPDLRARAGRARKLAERSGNSAIVRWALQAVMISETSQGRFDSAIDAGWRALGLSGGYAVWEAEALINLGQLMLEAGHPDRARSSFSAALERSAPARLLLPALGGLAVASALVKHEPTVEWTVREVWRAQEQSVQPYSVAAAHLECAVALRSLGRDADAERHRAAAEELGRRHGFHEVAFKADALRDLSRKAPAPLAPESESITGQLSRMAPTQLPRALAFDVAAV